MKKNDIIKILLISLVNYFLIFAVSTFIFLEFISIAWPIMTIISTFLLVYYWYFATKPKSPIKEGFIIGLIIALVTFVIEFLMWFSTFNWFYFLYPIVILQYILLIIVPIFAAIFKEEKIIPVKKKEPNWKNRL